MKRRSRNGNPGGQHALDALAAWRDLAPWNLPDLVAVTSVLLEAAGVSGRPPSERTVRFYVSQGLVDAPEGRGPAAAYRYRHLLQTLGVRLKQAAGQTLDAAREDLDGLDPVVLEKTVAEGLGAGIPGPEEVRAAEAFGERKSAGAQERRGAGAQERKSARAQEGRRAGGQERKSARAQERGEPRSTIVRRISVAPGAQLELAPTHDLFRHAGSDDTVAEAVAQALADIAAGLNVRGS